MPSAADFRRGFGLNKNHPLGQGLTITESHVGHEVKEQNERYEFPITLLVAADSSGGGRHVLAAWKELVGRKQKQIIYSAYGSPYECSISATPKVQSLGDGILELTSIGQARRRRDVPTQAQEKQARPPAGEPSSAEVKPLQPKYRFIKSRFGTSKCAICEETIDPGVRIGKRQVEEKRGSWAHAGCILEEHGLRDGGDGVRSRGRQQTQAAAKPTSKPAGKAAAKPAGRTQG